MQQTLEILSVQGLNLYVRSLLDENPFLSNVAVRGEVSNFRHYAASGHFYFSLKDGDYAVKAVMFRQNAQRLGFMPKDGMKVILRGRASLYEKDASFQLYADALFPDGQGAAQIAFEQLRAKLEKEGLLAPERKRPLPAFPKRIALVTSKHGAALQDVISVAARRWPLVKIVLYPVAVQGKEAEGQIERAILAAGRRADVDALVVTRGGGASEELWVFNSERIARAAAVTKMPVVSAVGHEIDTTILDFIADLRAPTPSAAAEMVLPDKYAVLAWLTRQQAEAKGTLTTALQQRSRQLRELAFNLSPVHFTEALAAKERHIAALETTLQARIHRKLAKAGTKMTKADASLFYPQRLRDTEKSLTFLAYTLRQGIGNKLAQKHHRTATADAVLQSLDPERIFRRGYAAIFHKGSQIGHGGGLAPGDALSVQFSDLAAHCTVQSIDQAGGYHEEKSQF